MGVGLRRDGFREMAQMHRQLGGNFRIAEVVKQFQDRAFTLAIENDGALAPNCLGPSFTGIAAIVIGSHAPYVLEPFRTGHGPDRPALPIDDCNVHSFDGSLVGKIAIAVEIADLAIDAQGEEDAGH